MGNTILDNILKNTIWILAGILAGVVVSLMIISGSGSLNQFYDGGAVYDVLSYHRTNDAAGAFYDTNIGVYTVTEQEAYIFCELSGMEKDWNYIILDLSGMQGAQIQGTAEYFDLNGNLVKTQDVTLREGRNTIEADAVYSRMQIWINQQAGVTFSIDKMQFREKLVDFSWKTFAAITGIVFCGISAVDRPDPQIYPCEVGLVWNLGFFTGIVYTGRRKNGQIYWKAGW